MLPSQPPQVLGKPCPTQQVERWDEMPFQDNVASRGGDLSKVTCSGGWDLNPGPCDSYA